jgi:RNA polymerase sigma-70 factor (sigma-E family)
MRTHDEDSYRQFAAVQLQRLQRPAYLLCGNWHGAEDLVQTTLIKMYGAWSRLGPEVDRHAYARRVLVNAYISSRRKHWWRHEVATDELPEAGRDDLPGPDVAERERQRALLMALPPRQRAVIVLRFWEDFSVEQTAQALGIATGTVKSQSAEALKTLRISVIHQETIP